MNNKQNDVQNLMQQKTALGVQLSELEVKKERLTLRAPEDGPKHAEQAKADAVAQLKEHLHSVQLQFARLLDLCTLNCVEVRFKEGVAYKI